MEALELDPASEEIRSVFMDCTILKKKKKSLSLQAFILDDTCREVTGALTSAAHFEQQHNP